MVSFSKTNTFKKTDVFNVILHIKLVNTHISTYFIKHSITSNRSYSNSMYKKYIFLAPPHSYFCSKIFLIKGDKQHYVNQICYKCQLDFRNEYFPDWFQWVNSYINHKTKSVPFFPVGKKNCM